MAKFSKIQKWRWVIVINAPPLDSCTLINSKFEAALFRANSFLSCIDKAPMTGKTLSKDFVCRKIELFLEFKDQRSLLSATKRRLGNSPAVAVAFVLRSLPVISYSANFKFQIFERRQIQKCRSLLRLLHGSVLRRLLLLLLLDCRLPYSKTLP